MLKISLRDRNELRRAFALDVGREAPVTGYEPNTDEKIAEAFRLYVLNPALLEQGRPRRFAFMQRRLKVSPVETADWQTVLADMPKRLHAQVERWLVR